MVSYSQEHARGAAGRGVAGRLEPLLTRILGDELPIRIRAWDGSEVGRPGAPAFVIHDRRALRRMLWKPGEIGLTRAYVAGELDVEGDMFHALGAIFRVIHRRPNDRFSLQADHKREIIKTAVTLGAVGPEPAPPPEELQLTALRPGGGEGDGGFSRHLVLPNRFYELLLGEPFSYSAARWSDAAAHGNDLTQAQRDAFDEVARRLGVRSGSRVLDLGCGWGSLALHLAREYGARVVGLTPSPDHAVLARDRIARAGASDHVDIRTGGVAEVTDGPFDAIASVGGAGEHLGAEAFGDHARTLYSLLCDGGALLNTQLERRPGRVPVRPTFITGYVFPDGVLLPLSEVVAGFEEAGFEVGDVTAARADYVRTIRCWVDNLRAAWTECAEVTSPGTVRVRLLYLVATALALEAGWMNAHQLVAVRRHADGRATAVPESR